MCHAAEVPQLTPEPAYLIVAELDLPLDAVSLRHRPNWSDGWTDALDAARQNVVDRERARGHALLCEPDGSLPPLYRYEGHRFDGTRLVLDTCTTDYAAHLLTNVENPGWREDHGAAVMADALGVSGLVVTADNRIVVGRRSARTHEAVGAFHVAPSGHPHPPQTIPEAFAAELLEELGVRDSEVRRGRLTGLIRAVPTGKPELTARLDLRIDAEEVIERSTTAVEGWEFENLELVEWRSTTVAEWLTDNGTRLVAPGHAAITLAAHAAFGPEFASEPA